MRLEPPVPSAVTVPSDSKMMVGAIIDDSRVHPSPLGKLREDVR